MFLKHDVCELLENAKLLRAFGGNGGGSRVYVTRQRIMNAYVGELVPESLLQPFGYSVRETTLSRPLINAAVSPE